MDSAPGALSGKSRDREARGLESKRIQAPFSLSKELIRVALEKQSIERDEKGKAKVRTMTVLFSELLVPGWAEGEDAKIGLDAVTGIYGDENAFTLPCHNSNPEIFFSEKSDEIAYAKSLCGGCPVKKECLQGALSRQEPCGVWGGELFEDGGVIAAKRMPGRPRLNRELIGA